MSGGIQNILLRNLIEGKEKLFNILWIDTEIKYSDFESDVNCPNKDDI